MVVSASRGLAAGETDRLIATYDLETARDAARKPEPGATVERFDLPRSAARGRVGALIERLVRERLEKEAVPGTGFRNLQAAVALRRLVTRCVAFPSYVLAYRNSGSLYRVVISGQDATCVTGTAPTPTAQIQTVVLGGLAALALVMAMIAALERRSLRHQISGPAPIPIPIPTTTRASENPSARGITRNHPVLSEMMSGNGNGIGTGMRGGATATGNPPAAGCVVFVSRARMPYGVSGCAPIPRDGDDEHPPTSDSTDLIGRTGTV